MELHIDLSPVTPSATDNARRDNGGQAEQAMPTELDEDAVSGLGTLSPTCYGLVVKWRTFWPRSARYRAWQRDLLARLADT
jgi:hypothetical protein